MSKAFFAPFSQVMNDSAETRIPADLLSSKADGVRFPQAFRDGAAGIN